MGTPRQINRHWLRSDGQIDLEAEFASRGMRTTAAQLKLLGRVASSWIELELLPSGKNRSLWKCCPNASECWDSLGPERKPPKRRGGITLPWVGPHYPQSRVTLMGLNLVRSGGLLDEINITSDTINSFRQGRSSVWHGSRTFQHRSAGMLAAVLAAIDGDDIPEELPPVEELEAALLRTARIQAIKCSPWGDGASKPSSAMKRNCLPSFMPAEISVLKPSVVLVAHSEARGRLWYAAGKPKWDDKPGLTVGKAELEGHEFTVLGVTHPSDRGGHWNQSWKRLIDYLQQRGDELVIS